MLFFSLVTPFTLYTYIANVTSQTEYVNLVMCCVYSSEARTVAGRAVT